MMSSWLTFVSINSRRRRSDLSESFIVMIKKRNSLQEGYVSLQTGGPSGHYATTDFEIGPGLIGFSLALLIGFKN